MSPALLKTDLASARGSLARISHQRSWRNGEDVRSYAYLQPSAPQAMPMRIVEDARRSKGA